MSDLDLYLKNLIGKDEVKAQDAANYLVHSADIRFFEKLVDKTDYLFDFVRNNVFKRISKAINQDNFKNIIKFFTVYSPDYDDFFANILAKNADENLTDEMFEFLENGTIAQKTYSAKYFYYIPDTIAIELLSKYAFCDDENLCYNSAEALGQMQDDISYNIALGSLQSSDDFEKLKAVKFFCAYGKNFPISEIFVAMKTSKMPENIAGQIPYMKSLLDLIKSQKTKSDALLAIDYIISGLGEILPLSDIFQFELFELTENLIDINKKENPDSGEISEILLKSYSKFMLFTENQEYIFDETQETKYEISAIYKLLKSQGDDFWNLQKQYVISELDKDKERVLAALSVIKEYSLTTSVDSVRKILAKNDDEVILCESLSLLKALNVLKQDDILIVNEKIHNPNIKAIIDNLL